MPSLGSQALLRVLPYTRYDLSALSGATIEIPIAQHIDVLGYENVALQVRVRSGTLPAGSSIRVRLADDGFDPADPSAADFLRTSVDGKDIGGLTVPEGTVFPFYQSIPAAVAGNFGRLMGIVASFTGGTEGGPSVVMSMDLLLTGGAVGTGIQQPSTYLGYSQEPVEPEDKFESLSFDAPPSAGFPADLGNRLIAAIRFVLEKAKVPPGYPRFGNVNVAFQGERTPPEQQ
jgi:hypothetical protein